MTRRVGFRTAMVAIAAVAVFGALSGCGDDDGEEAEGRSFCELWTEVEAASGEQLDPGQWEELQSVHDALPAAAPPEIDQDVRIYVDYISDPPLNPTGTVPPDYAQAFESIRAFHTENCVDGPVTTTTPT